MPINRVEDETTADSLKLLSQYRDICENLGGLRANDSRPPQQLQERLARVEAELQSRLACGGRHETASKSSVISHQSGRESGAESRESELQHPQDSGPSTQDSTQDSGLRTQDSGFTSSPITHHSTNGVAEVYSDGACSGNPGPGGYGTIVRLAGHPDRELSGGKARSTNNEMEMTGAIEGLKAAAGMNAREITVYSDSEYLIKGMNDWMKGWLRNGWKTRTGHPVKNRELWEELHRLSQGRAVTWKWVAGHVGHPENERCNDLAVAAAKQAAGRR